MVSNERELRGSGAATAPECARAWGSVMGAASCVRELAELAHLEISADSLQRRQTQAGQDGIRNNLSAGSSGESGGGIYTGVRVRVGGGRNATPQFAARAGQGDGGGPVISRERDTMVTLCRMR